MYELTDTFVPIIFTTTYWLKIAIFSTPIRRLRSLCSLWNFTAKLIVRKLVMVLSSSEDRMIVA